MKVAIFGLQGCGKTTIFNSLAGSKTQKTNIAVVKVPDKRLDYLSTLYPGKRRVNSMIEFIDVSSHSFETLHNVDAITIVIRCFDPLIEPIKELNTIETEFILKDLMIVEKRLNALLKGKKQAPEMEIINKCKGCLENNTPLRKMGFSEEKKKPLSPYQFLTLKPIILLANISEDMLNCQSDKIDELREHARIQEIPLIIACGKLEEELSFLEEAEREVFLKGLKIEESVITSFIRAAYAALGLISFFTIGKDEVRQWAIPKGTSATKAAGKIHSDIERGFIRASVISLQELIEAGSMQNAKEKGKIRLEGKDYIVKDGDIIEFRFNV